MVTTQQTFLESEPPKTPQTLLDKVEKVEFQIIDQAAQRYQTVGDWVLKDEGKTLLVSASRFEDIRYSHAILFHEYIEAVGCLAKNIHPDQVDEFDMGPGGDYDEPGKHPSAPYHEQHIFAFALERRFIQALGVDWDTYDKEVTDKGTAGKGV